MGDQDFLKFELELKICIFFNLF